MAIKNIIDRRKRPYRFETINAVIEPTRHDNRCEDADQAAGKDAWMGYDEREHISLSEAIEWAATFPDELTLYIYDRDGGIYAVDRHAAVSRS